MRSKLKNKKRWGPKKNSPEFVYEKCALISQSGGGAGGERERENEGLDYLFIYSAGHHGRHF
jgi:hypothetical protein